MDGVLIQYLDFLSWFMTKGKRKRWKSTEALYITSRHSHTQGHEKKTNQQLTKSEADAENLAA